MNSRFWIILGVVALVLVGVLVFKGDKKDSTSKAATTPTNHVTGTDANDVTLVEYGDYQCAYCALFQPTVEQIIEKYKDRIRFQFRHYPLQQVHQNAFAAARAAEAADAQGKFWEMHELLYAGQSSWKDAANVTKIFEGYAKTLQLNLAQYKTDYASSKVNGMINADMKEFDKLKLRVATPTFLLNGKQVTPANSVEEFSKLIDEALAKKQQ
jgi:protein-disulfide isomerase